MTPANTNNSLPAPGLPRSGGWGRMLLVAAMLFVCLSGVMWWQQHAALEALNTAQQLDATGRLRPIAQVSRAIKAMDLVSIVMETTVVAHSGEESWRGDVDAKVRAPVRLLYGTDLSSLGQDAVRLDPFGKAMLVTVPRPRRLAVEVIGEAESSEVRAGWLRLRSMAGEYHLGLARRGLYESAQKLVLKPEDVQMIEEATKDRIAELVRSIAGDKTSVMVQFTDPAPSAVTEVVP